MVGVGYDLLQCILVAPLDPLEKLPRNLAGSSNQIKSTIISRPNNQMIAAELS